MFEWDPQKAKTNADKHGVPFDEAVTVFLDVDALDVPICSTRLANRAFGAWGGLPKDAS